MDDLTETDSGLDFNNPAEPQKIHGNWFWERLQEYTMERESKIKGETMGLNIRERLSTQAGMLLTTAITGEVSYATNNSAEIMTLLSSFKEAYEAFIDRLPETVSLGQHVIDVLKDIWYSKPSSLQVFLHYVSASIIIGIPLIAISEPIPLERDLNNLEKLKKIVNE